METKECRHCKQSIHKDARRCQHCQGMQGWISDQKDPRMMAVVLIPALIILVGVFMMTRTFAKLPGRSEINPASLSVSNITFRFGHSANRDYIYIYGDLANSSSIEASQTYLRVNLLNQNNTQVDTFVQDTGCVSVPAKETKRFRIVAYTPAKPAEVKKAEVSVDRCRARGRWD
jgi:predicted nucleic acid-binding Zn ribbon protein